MKKEDRNIILILVALLFLWKFRHNKFIKTIANGSSGNVGVCEDPNNMFRYGVDSPADWLWTDYLVGVDPELKGDYVPFYYCCPDKPPMVGLQWMDDNDPLSSKWNTGAVVPHSHGHPTFDTKTKKIFEAMLYQCTNPNGNNSALCTKYNEYLSNPNPAAWGRPNWGVHVGLTQCFSFPEYLQDKENSQVLYTYYYGGTSENDGSDYWGYSNISKIASNFNSCTRTNLATGNQVGIRKIRARFDYLKNDGTIGQYDKSWILEGCNTFCSTQSDVATRKWSGENTCETLGLLGKQGCTDPNYAEYDPDACYTRALGCNQSMCQTPI